MYQHFQNQHPNKVEPLENITCVADQLKGLDTKSELDMLREYCEHTKDSLRP